jgi:hypothetical protein
LFALGEEFLMRWRYRSGFLESLLESEEIGFGREGDWNGLSSETDLESDY